MSASFYRRLLLIAALVCIGLFVAWLALPVAGDAVPTWARYGVIGTPLAIGLKTWDTALGPNAIFLGLMLLTQWALLHRLRRPPTAGPVAGRPRWRAAMGVGFAATLLCVAVIATVLEIPNAWAHALAAVYGWPMWTGMVLIWAAWSVVFLIHFRSGDFLGRAEVVVRALIRGSCLELLIAIPTHALVYRRSTNDCYCERGSYTGLVFGSAVLIWAFGPGLMLLYLRERQRRAPILLQLCPRCGASLDSVSAPSAACPRCGLALPAAGAAPPSGTPA